jgi:signal transduction histidine kinase
VERERIGCYPLRIFADLISNRNTFTLEHLTPLADVVSRFQHCSDTAMAVLGSPQQLVGVVTRRSLLETLLEHERRLRSYEFDEQGSTATLSLELLPVDETKPPRNVQLLATEWVLSESRGRQQIAGEIHDRLRQLLVVARVHLSQSQKLSMPGHASARLAIVDQLLEESIAYGRLLIEELTPAGLRTGGLISALDALAVELRQGGNQVRIAASPSNLKLSDPITAFLYRAVRSFLRQARGEDASSLITVSMQGEPAGIIRVMAAISGKPWLSRAEEASLFGPMLEKTLAGIQACGNLLGIAVSVESSPGAPTALILDVSLRESSNLL